MSNIKVASQYIKDLQFDLPSAPDIFLNPQDKPDIALSVDIDAKKLNETLYEISLKIGAKATVKKEQFFNCNITYAGIFAIEKIEKEMIEQVLLIYCPNLLFPYLRRIVTNITTDAGLAPLMLDPIDFAHLYNKRNTIANSEPISDSKN